MALSYKARKRLSYLILIVGLPLYMIAAVSFVAVLPRLPVALEFVMYVLLGVLWVFPFRSIFRGIAKPDPDAAPEEE
ncbi:DUF2842 domain-containing protein [Jannaschia sp. 2305UL9-9]|uniref:DUF2842 domain-containing protein n=1 Tax=Jannaschia sp. 2305UL9-9 TaxID=3121638 RepID=UPI003529904A